MGEHLSDVSQERFERFLQVGLLVPIRVARPPMLMILIVGFCRQFAILPGSCLHKMLHLLPIPEFLPRQDIPAPRLGHVVVLCGIRIRMHLLNHLCLQANLLLVGSKPSRREMHQFQGVVVCQQRRLHRNRFCTMHTANAVAENTPAAPKAEI